MLTVRTGHELETRETEMSLHGADAEISHDQSARGPCESNLHQTARGPGDSNLQQLIRDPPYNI